jgi:hypothetical protein
VQSSAAAGVGGGGDLTVAGTIQSTSGGFIFPDGTVQSSAAAGVGGGGDLTVAGTIQSTTGGFKFPDGTVQSSAAAAGASWSPTGNGGTTPGTNFLGTTDNVALELHVNAARALRLEPTATTPNIIGGISHNTVTSGVIGATISGGGLGTRPNGASGNFGTIGGGSGNTVGQSATVGGGGSNNASAWGATVGGGHNNKAKASSATVGGGDSNTASGISASIGGGVENTAKGFNATVPGGRNNVAEGRTSFAAGHRAKANHDGTFVWADHTDTDFASTAAKQFLIRAGGGVGIGTNSPSEQLTVAGTVESTTGGFKFPDGTVQTSAGAGGGVSGYEIITARVQVPGGTEGTLNAVCPTGKKATGGGFAMGTGLLERENHPGIRPGGDVTTFGEAWFVRAFNPTGTQLLMTVYAVCATV